MGMVLLERNVISWESALSCGPHVFVQTNSVVFNSPKPYCNDDTSCSVKRRVKNGTVCRVLQDVGINLWIAKTISGKNEKPFGQHK